MTQSLMPAEPDAQHMLDPSSLSVVIFIVTVTVTRDVAHIGCLSVAVCGDCTSCLVLSCGLPCAQLALVRRHPFCQGRGRLGEETRDREAVSRCEAVGMCQRRAAWAVLCG